MRVIHFSVPSERHRGPQRLAEALARAESALGTDASVVGEEVLGSPVRVADVVVFHTVPAEVMLRLPCFVGAKKVLWLHAMPEHWLASALEEGARPLFLNVAAIAVAADALITEQARAAPIWERWLGRGPEIVAPGIDLAEWSPVGESASFEGKPAIFCPDAPSPMKNPFAVVSALPNRAVLHILGDDDAARALAPMRKLVRVHPRTPKIDRYYRAAPITLSSLAVEDVSRSEMEAAACGSFPCKVDALPDVIARWRRGPDSLRESALHIAEQEYDIRRTAKAALAIFRGDA